MTREQYEAAIAQETQTFSLADAEAAGGYPDSTPPYGYDLPSGPARRGTAAYPYANGQPSQHSQPMPVTPSTPPHGQNYGYDGSRNGTRDGTQPPDPRWGSGARDYRRQPAASGRPEPGRGERPAYPAGYPGPYDARGTDRY